MNSQHEQELLVIFLEEVSENLEKSYETLKLLEDSDDQSSLLNNLARYIHTIKGGCGMFNMTEAQEHAHSLEDFLKDLNDSKQTLNLDFINTIASQVDELESIFSKSKPQKSGIAESKEHTTEASEFLRVPMRLVNDALNNIWEIFLIRNQMTYFLGKASDTQDSIKDFLQDWDLLDSALRRNITELEGKVMSMRMTNLKGLYNRMDKVVRAYSSSHQDKNIRLITSGAEVEVDKKVSDMLSEPFIHLIRNALDHGIESSERRIKIGKPAHGTIKISSHSSADKIRLIIEDDGNGIDAGKVKTKAMEKGLIDSLDIDEKTAINLIFKPGFSTAQEVTDVSGRGVGMDSVKSSIEALGGDIQVDTKVGIGSTFTINLPLSLSVVSAVIYEDGGKVLGSNTSNVAEIVYCEKSQIRKNGNHSYYKFRDKFIPCIRLSDILTDYNDSQTSLEEELPLLVLYDMGRYLAITVDKIIDDREIIVKPTPALLPKIDYIDGMSILPTGEPIFMLSLTKILSDFFDQNRSPLHDAA